MDQINKPKTKMQNPPTGIIIFIILLVVGITSLIGFKNLQKKIFQNEPEQTNVEKTVVEDLTNPEVVSAKALSFVTNFSGNREIYPETGTYFNKRELDNIDSLVEINDYNLVDKVGNVDIWVNKTEIKNFSKLDLLFLKSILVDEDGIVTKPKTIILVDSKDNNQDINPLVSTNGPYINYYYNADFLQSLKSDKEVMLYEGFQTDLAIEISKSNLFQLAYIEYLDTDREENEKVSLESIYANSTIFESVALAYGYIKNDSNDKFVKSDNPNLEYDHEDVIKEVTDNIGLILSGQVDSFSLGNYSWIIKYLGLDEEIILSGKPYFEYIAIDPLVPWAEKMKENDLEKTREIKEDSDFVSITTYRINDNNKDSYLNAANKIEEMLIERGFVISASTKDLAKSKAIIEADFVGMTIYIEIENYEDKTANMKGALVYVVEGINY